MTNASVAMDQEEYNRQFAEYEARYNAIKEKRAATEAEYTRRNAKRGQIAEYLSHIRDQSLITGFNETLWYGTAERVRVTVDGKLRFIFKGGQEVTV